MPSDKSYCLIHKHYGSVGKHEDECAGKLGSSDCLRGSVASS